MSISIFSPGRINLIGEHTDYNLGFVLPAAIHLGIKLHFSSSKNSYCTLHSLDLQQKANWNIEQAINKMPRWIKYFEGVISESRKLQLPVSNFDCSFGGDLPIGAGCSSSSALTCGIVEGLDILFNWKLQKNEKLNLAVRAEYHSGLIGGAMDQFSIFYSEKNNFIWLDCQDQSHKKISWPEDAPSLALVNSGVQHNLADTPYQDRKQACQRVVLMAKKWGMEADSLRDLDEENLLRLKTDLAATDYQKAKFVWEENQRVTQAIAAIQAKDWASLGQLLNASHHGLKDQYKVSCTELDSLQSATASIPEVYGSRMMGGGFGGCTINLVRKGYEDIFASHIQEDFQHKHGRNPKIYFPRLGGGVRAY